MKIIVSILVLLACLSMNAKEQMRPDRQPATVRATSFYLGYCSDKVFKGIGSGKSDFLKAAIQIPVETAMKFKGNQLTKIRVALSESGFANAKLFLTYTKEGKPFYSQNVTFTGQDIWDEITLNTPYEIEGKEFFIGYSFISKNGTFPVQADDRPTNPLGGWLSLANEWTHISKIAKVGNLSITGVIEGDHLPLYNVSFESVYMDHYIKPGTPFKIKAQIKNCATGTIQRFKVSYQAGDASPVDTVFNDANIPYGELYDFSIHAITQKEGKQQIKVCISELNGNEDEDPSNNELIDTVYCRPDFQQRKIVLEQFTSRITSDTPGIIENFDKSVSVRDNINRVIHFAGYAPDEEFTLPESVTYTWLYNDPPYANGAMIDRSDLSGYRYPGSDFTPFEKGSPVFIAATYSWHWGEEVKTFLGRVLDGSLGEMPALVDVDITKSYEEKSRILNLSVSVKDLNIKDFGELSKNLRLNVFLLEDNIRADQSMPKGGVIYYKYNNVLRKVLSETWGDEFTFSGDTYVKEYTYYVPLKLNDKNVKVLAFVSTYDKKNPLNCRIYNSETLAISGNILSDVSEVPVQDICVYTIDSEVVIRGDYQRAAIYDLMGNLVKETKANQSSFMMKRGIYVVKVDDKLVKKIIISK